MDQITCSYTESSSSSSYDQKHPQPTIKPSKSSYHNSLHSVRNPARLQKPATTKHFIAPLPPTPVKIYEVEPSKFKDLVRILTSAPKFHHPSPRRLKDKAPPPLILSTTPKLPSLVPKSTPPPKPQFDDDDGGTMSPLSTFLMSPDFYNLLNETMQTGRSASLAPGVDYFDGLNLMSPVGLGLSSTMPVTRDESGGALISLSPTSLSWCSSVLFGHQIE
ncbi:hypothetical protein SSX86_032659 [Deinandra increscens subsp. villosa]|uniref:VQ domain-containing protein n=1 Tax=Deinandra increscens subsp. villosa TaxID=3103831 RepID=A0AAP0C4N4_9ASTR